jgi:hypothetical protein
MAELNCQSNPTSAESKKPFEQSQPHNNEHKGHEVTPQPDSYPLQGNSPSLHYNIEIHLPATKDIEVYNAIFKSIKEHLFE